MVAKEIMDSSAALLNDINLTVYTYAKQVPFLNIALDDLQEVLQANNVAITNKTDTEIVVNAGVLTIGGGGGDPALPNGLIEIQRLWERLNGSSSNYIPMVRKEFLPLLVTQTSSLIYWAWMDQVIKFIGATTDRQIRIDFISDVIPKIADENDNIDIIGSQSFLTYRTASLCAQYLGENETRANLLNGEANSSIDKLLSINTKGRQAITTRRRPFMAGYKSRRSF
jgi:hypothetical protein